MHLFSCWDLLMLYICISARFILIAVRITVYSYFHNMYKWIHFKDYIYSLRVNYSWKMSFTLHKMKASLSLRINLEEFKETLELFAYCKKWQLRSASMDIYNHEITRKEKLLPWESEMCVLFGNVHLTFQTYDLWLVMIDRRFV